MDFAELTLNDTVDGFVVLPLHHLQPFAKYDIEAVGQEHSAALQVSNEYGYIFLNS